MTTYELLDHIADSVNPTLGLLALATPWLPSYRRRPPSPWLRIAAVMLCVGVGYAGQAFDRLTGAWPALSLDYSGHTAMCLAFLISLAHLTRKWLMASLVIGVAYAGLMMYQGYHTFADIVTTGIPVGLICWAVWHLILRRAPSHAYSN